MSIAAGSTTNSINAALVARSTSGAVLSGAVSLGGVPMANAGLYVFTPAGVNVAAATTTASGTYSVVLAPGRQ